ncbi:MAG: prolyl oligopeptidase family serine peptidase [Bacteroidota bacterium]
MGNLDNANTGVATDSNPYQRSYSWSGHWRRDIYTIDLTNGQRQRIATAASERARVSPEGNYYYWYEVSDSNWMVYDVAENLVRNVSKEMPYPIWDEDDDHPMIPGSYGSAGWLSNDEAFLIYDKYDIWQIDPNGKTDPVCLTGVLGRKQQMRFRMNNLYWNEQGFIPKRELQIITGFNTKTMASGLFHLDIRKQAVKELAYGDRSYSRVEKAEEAKVVLFAQSTYRESRNYYGADWDLKKVSPLSSLNPQQEEIAWGNVELVSYRSLSGEPLNGLLFKPEDFDPTKKYPMIVYFYEKYAESLHNYFMPRPSSSTINFPWAVSNGYLLFVPDIIYKEGLPGPSAYDCIVPGTLAMIDRGYVDEAKIGLQGQSWGGYQTAYLVTRTNLYACASAGAIVSNMTSAYGGIRWGSGLSRMFQYERTQSRIGGTLWERRDMYIENSPVFFADRVETPLLLMHNDEDTAVPWYQGIEMFVAMRRLDKPVWMVNYNGEPHNLRQWRNRMDLSMRMGQFFNHYLKDEPMPLWMSEGIPAKDKGRYLGYELDKDAETMAEQQ